MGRVNSPKAGSSTSTAGKASGDKSPRSSNEKTASSDTSPQECHRSESPANTTTSAKKGTPTTAGQNQPPDKPAPGQSATRAAESNSPVRRQDTGRAGPEHPRARKTGPCTPPRTRKLPVYLGRVGGSVPSQTFLTNLSQRAEEVGQEQTTTLHHPPKNKSQNQSQSQSQSQSVVKGQQNARVKPVSGTDAAKRAGYPGQWCRSSRPRGLNHRGSRRASPIRRVLRKTQRATLKGGPYWCANTIRAISARPRTSATPLP
jgi:hypothetical protein